MIEFSWEPSVTLGCGALGAAYLLSIGPWRDRFAGSNPVERWRVASFLAGLGVLMLALASPLDTLSDRYLLSAHMVQHMLLTLTMPPLLLAGTPGWLLRPLLRRSAMALQVRFWTRPLVAFLAFNLTVGLSHFPLIYNFTLENHGAHIAEHLAYMATAVLMWWPLLSPLPELPRLSYPLQMLYMFLQTIPGALVGSLITLSDRLLYPVYAAAPRLWGLSPQADQQLGGLIMWIGVSTLFFAIMTVVFFVWASREEGPKSQVPGPKSNADESARPGHWTLGVGR